MNLDESIAYLGNGDWQAGKNRIVALAERLEHARSKHKWGQNTECGGIKSAITALNGEITELMYAYDSESRQRQDDEALDVLAVAVRIANREFENH